MGERMVDRFVSTGLGRLHVRRTGAGPPVVLWHSLFIDSQSWGPVADAFAADRTVYAIDGPSHGRSDPALVDFTFDECLAAACDALDQLGLDEPVDWVGNAWGGHVGIQLASRHPHRIRTLTTIGTPVHGLTARERWVMCWPLVLLYRMTGPSRLLLKALSNPLVGPEAVVAQPDRAARIIASFASADRAGMFHAMRSMMLRRPSMDADARRITAPTLFVVARDDAMGWQERDAEAVTATMADAKVAAVAGTGHVSPLLLDADGIERAVREFWDDAPIPYRPSRA
jgi:pimeloyl-ACP methyl ester carboxylesterase